MKGRRIARSAMSKETQGGIFSPSLLVSNEDEAKEDAREVAYQSPEDAMLKLGIFASLRAC